MDHDQRGRLVIQQLVHRVGVQREMRVRTNIKKAVPPAEFKALASKRLPDRKLDT